MLLSICIPSYNRLHILKKTVEEILQSSSKDFEIVIIDNGSSEDINKEIIIEDSRLRIIKKDIPVSGPHNFNECTRFAHGKYAMILLDQDHINEPYLENFLKCLRDHPSIYGGYCDLDRDPRFTYNKFYVAKRGNNVEFCYASKHPSGEFYLTKHIQKVFSRVPDFLLENSFFFDILLTDCAFHGDMLRYNEPLITQANDKERSLVKSYSYSGKKKNLYFDPIERLKQFFIYSRHLNHVCRDQRWKRSVYQHLYRRTMALVTVIYKFHMENIAACAHYHIPTKYISYKELFYWWFTFNRLFLKHDIGISIVQRIYIITKTHTLFILDRLSRKLRIGSHK